MCGVWGLGLSVLIRHPETFWVQSCGLRNTAASTADELRDIGRNSSLRLYGWSVGWRLMGMGELDPSVATDDLLAVERNTYLLGPAMEHAFNL